MTPPTFVIAQLSDPHILAPGELLIGKIDTANYLRRAVAALDRLPQPADVVLVTGDLANDGRPAEYAHFTELLAPVRQPVVLLPGNHDDTGELARLLADRRIATIDPDSLPVRLVTLDTNIPRDPRGRLGDAQIADLDRRLAARPDHPTIVALHHPPFVTMIGHMDAIGLLDKEALAEVIVRHPQVLRVVCGHMHRAITTTFAGVTTMSCPSTAHAVALDLTHDGPAAWTTEPPGMLLHCWQDDVGLVTHHLPLGDWTGPHLFTD